MRARESRDATFFISLTSVGYSARSSTRTFDQPRNAKIIDAAPNMVSPPSFTPAWWSSCSHVHLSLSTLRTRPRRGIMQNLQLNMVTAVILIDNESNRIMAKYFHPEHADPKNPSSHGKQPFATLKEQRAFEAVIWEKTRKQTGTRVPVTTCALSEASAPR